VPLRPVRVAPGRRQTLTTRPGTVLTHITSLATHTTLALLIAILGQTVGPMALAALALLMATFELTVELAVHTAPALLMAALGLTVGLMTRVALALLMVTFGLTMELTTRVALAMLMATLGLTVGLAARAARLC